MSPSGHHRRCRLEAVPGGRLLAFEVAANGFLRHMVRALTGTLVEVGQGRRDPDLRALLASANRALAGPTAPAHGLWLVEVELLINSAFAFLEGS